MTTLQTTQFVPDVEASEPIRCLMPYGFGTDDRGRAIVKVWLETGEMVVLDRTDFERLSAAGVTCRQWFLQSVSKGSKLKYVAVRIDQHTRLVHRLILGVSEGERTRFRSKDKTDLRRNNFAFIPNLNMKSLYVE